MPNRYRKAKDCMESISARKRRCEFPMLGLGVHCECDAAMECPAAREVARLHSERPSPESCGREDRCEWKRTSIAGHKAAISRAEKSETEIDQLCELLDIACEQCGSLSCGDTNGDGTHICTGCDVFDWRIAKRGEG